MSDDLERLSKALRATTPHPSAEARARAVSAAAAAFDDRGQGIRDETRQKGKAHERAKSRIRRSLMPMSRSSFALAASAAFLVIAGVVFHQIMTEPESPPLKIAMSPRTEQVPAAAPPMVHETAPDQNIRPPRTALARRAPDSVRERVVASYSSSEAMDHYDEQGRDRFPRFEGNQVKVAAEQPVSTFSIDVDTASYGFLRASLKQGTLPPQAVRVEELINYFPYDYKVPESRDRPFAAHVSLMPAPWNETNRLLHIGIKGHAPQPGAAPRANLVFLIDTSGSMNAPNKLPLLINSFKLLLGALTPEDRVAIVTYAGSAGTVLAPTPVAQRAMIVAALERLQAGGSTAGAEGIRQAYLLARQHFVKEGVNRVILATDGDFNVGITDSETLEGYIAQQRSSGVFLSVLGFGMGNYNDDLAQRLAQNGNGNAAYIDTLSEAHKVLVQEATSTLFPIAKDVKIQVEFNPATVSEYRLIGYETRMLAREDFRNDKVDAGEIGAGHTVTALYEITPAGSGAERLPPLRYQSKPRDTATEWTDELAFIRIRYKLPDSDTSVEITRPVTRASGFGSLKDAPPDARFAAAVAGFGQLLRGGRYTGAFSYDDVIELAQGGKGKDPFGYRAEFIGLVRLAQSGYAMEASPPLPRTR